MALSMGSSLIVELFLVEIAIGLGSDTAFVVVPVPSLLGPERFCMRSRIVSLVDLKDWLTSMPPATKALMSRDDPSKRTRRSRYVNPTSVDFMIEPVFPRRRTQKASVRGDQLAFSANVSITYQSISKVVEAVAPESSRVNVTVYGSVCCPPAPTSTPDRETVTVVPSSI